MCCHCVSRLLCLFNNCPGTGPSVDCDFIQYYILSYPKKKVGILFAGPAATKKTYDHCDGAYHSHESGCMAEDLPLVSAGPCY